MQLEIKGVISRFVDFASFGGMAIGNHNLGSGRVFFVGENRLLVKIIVGRKSLLYYVEANDKLITPRFIADGRYEIASTRYLLNNIKADSHCLDVGSNFGYFTVLMGALASHGKVIAVEADQRIAEIARDNVVVNNLIERVQVQHGAVNGDGQDVVMFRRVGRSGNTSISHCGEDFTTRLGEPAEQEFRVRGIRIDDLLNSMGGRVDFMKVDIEGAEPLAFVGAATTIATNPQLQVVMEWSPGQIRAAGFDVPTFLGDLGVMGLRPFMIRRRGVATLSFEDVLNLPYQAGLLLKRP